MDDEKQNPSLTPPINKTHHQSPPSRSPGIAVSGDKKMLTKLKIPKIKDGFDDYDDQIYNSQEQLDDDQTKVCDVCNKRFSSGKALGGHSRIHSQIKKLKSNSNDSNKTVIEPNCPICEKKFPSMKSMFGHMRCHRKIKRPGPENPSSSSSVTNPVPQKPDYKICDSHEPNSELRVIDLTKSLNGWSTTARRGRKSLNGAVSVSISGEVSEKEKENLRDAMEILMRIANGNSLDSELTHNNVVDESEATISNSMTKKPQIEENNWVVLESKNQKIEEHSVGSGMVKKLRVDEKSSINGGTSSVTPKTMDKGKGKAVLETGFSHIYPFDCTDWKSEYDPDEKSDSRNSNGSTVGSDRLVNHKCEEAITTMVKNKRKRRKKMKLIDLESNIHGNKHVCATCNKSFSSFQALGGHRSSHNKSRNFQNVPEDHHEQHDEDHQHKTNSIEQFDEVQEVEPIVHQCKICNKTFPSGQALGGHQRSHWSSPRVEVEPPLNQVADHEDHEHNTNSMEQFDEVQEVEPMVHQCKICEKTFPSGQALGGHQRSHWTAPVEPPSSQVTSPGEASQTGRKGLDIDLNEPASMDEEEGIESQHEGGCGYGFQYFSNNSIA